MNTLRRVTRHMARAVASGAVLVAAGLPVAMASTAGAATAPTLTCVVASTSSATTCSSSTTASFGTGASGYVNFSGTGFADDQNVGGTVTVSSNAPGLTFSGAMETSTGTGYVAFTSTSATAAGFYNLTLTDTNGSVTLNNAIAVNVPTVTVTGTTGNSGISGGSNSSVVITGTGMTGASVTVGANTLVNPITLVSVTVNSSTQITAVVNNNPAGGASAGTYNLVVSQGLAGGAVNVPYTVVASSAPTITAISPSAGLGIPATGTSVQNVSITGTNYEAGATVSLGGTSTAATTSGTSPTSATESATLGAASTYSLTGDAISGTGVAPSTTVTNTAGTTGLTLSNPTTAWLSGTNNVTISGSTTGNVTTAASSTSATLTVVSAAGIDHGMAVTGGNLAGGATYTVASVSGTTVTLTASTAVAQTAGGSNATVNFTETVTATQTASAVVAVTSATGIVPGLTVTGTNVGTGNTNTVSSVSGLNVTLSAATLAPLAGTSLTFGGSGGESVSNVTVVSSTSITFQVTVQAGVGIHQDSVTVKNPDLGTVTGVNILGIGEAGASFSSTPGPVAPTITISEPFGHLTPGSTSIITVTGSSTFPITTGAVVSLTLTSDASASPLTLSGTVVSVTAGSNGTYVATVKFTLPRYVGTTISSAYTTGTTLNVTDGAGITNGSLITVVDGSNTEYATVASGGGTNTLTLGAALSNAHTAGVTVLYPIPSGAVWTLTVNNGSTPQSATATTSPAGSASLTDANGNTVTSLTPGTYSLTATLPGYGFTTGATVGFGTSGVTGSVTSASGNSAALSVTVPATTPVAATLAAATNVGAKSITVNAAGATAPAVGATLVIDPSATLSGTDTVTVASVTGTTSPFTVTLNQALAYVHPSGTVVTGFTKATGSAPVTVQLGNGAGQQTFVPSWFSTAAGLSFTTVTPSTVPSGTGTVDPAGYYNTLTHGVAFQISGGFSELCTNTGGSTEATSCANWTATSSNPAVTFTVLGVGNSTLTGAGTYVFLEPSVKPGTPATADVPVTIKNGSETVSTTTGQFGITAGPTISSITASGTLTTGSSTNTEIIGIVGTGFSASTGQNTVAFLTSSGAIDSGVSVTILGQSTTTLSIQVVATGTALNGVHSVMVETPGTNPGETVPFANALTVVAPVITAATPATIPVLPNGVTSTSTFTTSGFSATGTFGCSIAGSGTTPATVNSLGCTAAYAFGSTTAVTVTFTGGLTASTTGGVLVTLTNSGQSVSFPMTIIATPVVTGLVINTTAGTIAPGSANVPATITGSGFLPGATVAIAAATGTATFTVGTVTPTTISGTLSISTTATVPFVVSVTNTNGATGKFSYTTALGAAPTITGSYVGLTGQKTTLVLTGSHFASGAVVTVSPSVLATFGASTLNADGTLSVPVTFVGFSGATPMVGSITVTNPVGLGSVTGTGDLTVNPGPSVTGVYYVPTFSSNVQITIAGTGFQQGMTATSANADYTVTLVAVNTAGTAATLLVSTNSNATLGTSSAITFTNPDGGSVTFNLNGGPKPSTKVAPKAYRVVGYALTGHTMTLQIVGVGFYARPTITSNARGTVALVLRDTGKILTVRVSTKANTPRGIHTFRIHFANGETISVRYNQR